MTTKKIKIKIEKNEFEAEERTFSSGKKGFGLYGKIEINNEKYQMVVNIINIEKKKEENKEKLNKAE